jgi:hypothetical protein
MHSDILRVPLPNEAVSLFRAQGDRRGECCHDPTALC